MKKVILAIAALATVFVGCTPVEEVNKPAVSFETAAPAVDESARITVDVYGEPLTPLLSAILNERRKELFLEGDRWYELKRNGRPEFWAAKDGYKRTTRKFMYTFPLPIQDIELVDGLIQNPGYDKVQ